MKVILTHEVSASATPVTSSTSRTATPATSCFRRSLATAWTKGGQKQVDAIAKGREVRAVKSLEEAKSIKGNLENGRSPSSPTRVAPAACSVPCPPPTSPTRSRPAAARSSTAARSRSRTPIKSVGTHEALVRLHPEVQAKVTLDVVAG